MTGASGATQNLARPQPSRRVACVWLPDWPVTVWTRSTLHQKAPHQNGLVRSAEGSDPGPIPFALVERNGRGLCLRAVNGAAQQLGLWRGQSQADARAMAPDLVTVPADPAAEALTLKRLALWAERFRPAWP